MSVENAGAPAVEESIAVATPEAVEETITAPLEEDVAVVEAPDASEEPEAEPLDTEEAEAAPSDEAAEAQSDIDPLDGLVRQIPTQEEIEKRFNRVPKDARAEITRLAELAKTTTDKIDALGGDFAVDAVKPLAQLVTKASATDEQLGGAFNAVMAANPAVGLQLAQGMATAMFADAKLIDPILKEVLGENASLKNINELLTLEKSGYIDKEYLNGTLNSEYPNSNLYQQQTSEIEQLRQEVVNLKQALTDPAKAQAFQPNDRFISDFDAKVNSTVENALKPAFERLRWDAKSQLAQLVVSVMQSTLRNESAYKETEKYLRASGRNEGLENANLNLLENIAKARGIEQIRAVQSDLRNLSEKSRNAVLAEKKKVETVAKEKTVPQPLPDTDRYLTVEERQAKLRQQYKEHLQSQQYAEAVNSKV